MDTMDTRIRSAAPTWMSLQPSTWSKGNQDCRLDWLRLRRSRIGAPSRNDQVQTTKSKRGRMRDPAWMMTAARSGLGAEAQPPGGRQGFGIEGAGLQRAGHLDGYHD